MNGTKVIDKLAENHAVYALDLLGCGRSEKPKITYTNYLYVQLISDFIKNVIHEKQMLLPEVDFQVLLLYLHATMRMSFLETSIS